MTKKKSFLIYYDQQKVIDMLTDEEAGRVFKDLFRYGSQNTVPDYGNNRPMSIAFVVLKTTIDRDAEKYEATCKKNRENSKKTLETGECSKRRYPIGCDRKRREAGEPGGGRLYAKESQRCR